MAEAIVIERWRYINWEHSPSWNKEVGAEIQTDVWANNVWNEIKAPPSTDYYSVHS